MNDTPLERLQNDIQAELERDPRGPGVVQLLRAYSKAEDDWRPFALFDESRYARNLVYRSAEFEMMLVCWGDGQESPIHNHAGQHCWMAVLEGDIAEVHYGMPTAGQSTPLVEGRKCVHERGSVAYICDEIALHKVLPVAGQRGVSLHLYAKPIEVCTVYDSKTCQVGRRELSFHSVAGELTNA